MKEYQTIREYLKETRFPYYYDGKKHNYDSMRPAIGTHCRNVKGGKTDIKNWYTLENILVNGGTHDTYVLRNTKTWKTIKTLCIQVIGRK